MGGNQQWSRLGSSTTSSVDNKQRKTVKAKVPKRENIVFVGSEMSYNDFWWKMMFVAAACRLASTGQGLRPAHRKTLAYVDNGYTHSEKLTLEALRTLGFDLVALHSSADVVKCLNRERDDFKLQDVAFFSHGVVGQICLNYAHSVEVNVDEDNLSSIRSDAFASDGRIFSYACRTGTGKEDYKLGFKSKADAMPENSLAQKMADHLKVEVHAYMRRTLYRSVIRAEAEAEGISTTLKEQRKDHEGEIIDIPPSHQALPHPGLSVSWNPISRRFYEGVHDYALWRKRGGACLPDVHETPAGVPPEMLVYRPQ